MIKRRITVKNTKPERKFFKVYYDFLYNDMLNGEEKFIFSTLKSFLDFSMDKNGTEGEAFPTIRTLCKITSWGNQKVIKVIDSLVEKKFVKKIRRGLTKPNLYIIADYEEIWTAKNPEEVKEAYDNRLTLEDHITEIRKMGYEVEIKETKPSSASNATTMPESRKTEPVSVSDATTMSKNEEMKEKEPVPERLQTTGTSTPNLGNNTTGEPKSQEPYPMDFLKRHFEYKALVDRYPEKQTDIDVVFNLLYDTLNTQKPIRINGQDKPAAVVIGKLMKLDSEAIFYAIDKYHKQTERIKNVKAYLLTILYHAQEQMYLDKMNLERYNNYSCGPESDLKAKGSPENKQKKNRFNDYPHREYDFDFIKKTMFLQ